MMLWSCLILLIAVSEVLTQQTKEHETRLLDDLLTGYDSRVKPDGVNNETFHLYFDSGLLQIIDVDEKNQVFYGLYWQLQRWLDTELSWNPLNYSNIAEVHLTDDKIWHPNIGLFNEVDTAVSLLSAQTTRLSVHNSGFVTRHRLVNYVSSCSMNLRQFPFDTQNCTLTFRSYQYYAHQMNISTILPFSQDSLYFKDSEFNVKDIEKIRTVAGHSSQAVVILDYHIILERRPLFFMLNLMLPCSLITLIAMLSFCVTPDSGEKVGLGVTVLLSLSVFLLIISDQMPPSSEVPFITIYFFGAVVLVTLSTGLSILVLNIHHTTDRSREVPHWLRIICFGKLSRVLCVNSVTPIQHQTELKHDAETLNIQTQISIVNDTTTNNPHSMQTDSTDNSIPKKLISCFEAIVVYLRTMEESKSLDKQQEHIQQEWRKLAQVLDRIFLILFFSFSICFTLGILLRSAFQPSK